MAHFEDRQADRQTSAAFTSITDVKEDMVAIFGSDQRIAQKPADRPQLVRPSRHQGMIIAVASLCGAGLMLAAGIVGGKSVLNVSSSGLSKTDGLYKAAKFSSHNLRQEVAVEPEVQHALTVAVKPENGSDILTPSVAPAPHVTASRTAVSAGGVATADLLDTAVKRVPDVTPKGIGSFIPSTASTVVSRSAAPEGNRIKMAPPLVSRPSCSTNECVDPRISSDEQDVAAAYQEATIAGVRPKTLREYRAEWIRARGLASKRPAEAARVYRMIGSDLRLLAADPTID